MATALPAKVWQEKLSGDHQITIFATECGWLMMVNSTINDGSKHMALR